jgi:hypothetical protein
MEYSIMALNIYIYLEDRLRQWANWFLRHGDMGLGYPHRSVEGLLMDSGGVVIRSTVAYDASPNAAVDETERLLRQMASQNKKIATALFEYYIGVGTLKQRAKRLGLSRTQFKVHVDMAKEWLAGRLSSDWQAKEQKK